MQTHARDGWLLGAAYKCDAVFPGARESATKRVQRLHRYIFDEYSFFRCSKSLILFWEDILGLSFKNEVLDFGYFGVVFGDGDEA